MEEVETASSDSLQGEGASKPPRISPSRCWICIISGAVVAVAVVAAVIYFTTHLFR